MAYPLNGPRGYTQGFGRVRATGFTATSDGDATTPAYNFANNTNMGHYRAGSNDLRATIAGSSRISIQSSAIVLQDHVQANGNILCLGYLELTEIAAPSAPAADRVRIYAVVDGGSKTDLASIFQTGAAQAINGEP